jgi:hypothetical protein
MQKVRLEAGPVPRTAKASTACFSFTSLTLIGENLADFADFDIQCRVPDNVTEQF